MKEELHIEKWKTIPTEAGAKPLGLDRIFIDPETGKTLLRFLPGGSTFDLIISTEGAVQICIGIGEVVPVESIAEGFIKLKEYSRKSISLRFECPNCHNIATLTNESFYRKAIGRPNAPTSLCYNLGANCPSCNEILSNIWCYLSVEQRKYLEVHAPVVDSNNR